MRTSNEFRSAAALLALLLSGAGAMAQGASPKVSCESLAKLSLANTTITVAETVKAGELKLPPPGGPGAPGGAAAGHGAPGAPAAAPAGEGRGGPAPVPSGAAPGLGALMGGTNVQSAEKNPEFCRVTATIRPTSDSDIKIEVWLPASGWNGKFEGVGSGGLGGSIQQRNMLAPLVAGYAAASNNTGHEGSDLSFVPGHPEKFIDYAHRSAHEMTVKAKELIKAYYGMGPKHSYWVGCSLGGVEAVTEANRYPEDYDGIVAGSPVNPLTHFNALQMWAAWLNMKHPEMNIPGKKVPMINHAAIKACAGPAGLQQGFIDEPLTCKFDPGVLQCKGADADDCLTAPQVEFMRRLYEGPKNPRTGEQIFPGYAPGTELLLGSDGGAHPIKVALELYMNAVYQDPKWDWKTMDFDKDIELANKVVAPILDIPPDFTKFLNRGGKIMMYAGGAEQLNAKYVVGFYQEVLKKAPGKQESIRMFVNPGVGHCGGGTGCDTFEKLETIDKWVESGKAPNELASSKSAGGKTIRTRPLCAYPMVAKHKGQGSLDEASSFVCSK